MGCNIVAGMEMGEALLQATRSSRRLKKMRGVGGADAMCCRAPDIGGEKGK